MARSARVHLPLLQHCRGYDLLWGLTALWLMPAVAGWFARLSAVAAGRRVLTVQDTLQGLRRTHRTFGVSPAFAGISERFRLRALARPGVPGAILEACVPLARRT